MIVLNSTLIPSKVIEKYTITVYKVLTLIRNSFQSDKE